MSKSLNFFSSMNDGFAKMHPNSPTGSAVVVVCIDKWLNMNALRLGLISKLSDSKPSL